jgi:hypothetical protein
MGYLLLARDADHRMLMRDGGVLAGPIPDQPGRVRTTALASAANPPRERHKSLLLG